MGCTRAGPRTVIQQLDRHSQWDSRIGSGPMIARERLRGMWRAVTADPGRDVITVPGPEVPGTLGRPRPQGADGRLD